MKHKTIYPLAFVLVTALSVQGCSTINPYTKEEQTSSAAKGAGIGAAVGAILGIATSKDKKDRTQRALKGAGIGAIAGGSVGYYMDVQEAKLRKQLQGTGVSVTRNGNNLVLNLPGNITFDTNRTEVNDSFVQVLNSVTLVLKEYQSTMIEVAGHTDNVGQNSDNQILSNARARAVSDILIRSGVAAVRIDVVGYGETRPIASNDTANGRQNNRRVELTLIPLE